MKIESIDHTFLEECLEGAYLVDRNRRILFWNSKAEEITGYLSSEVIGKACYENILNHVDDKGTLLCRSGCPLHATIVDGQTRQSKVYLHHKDGHRKPFMVKTLPIYEKQNDPIAAVELFVECTSTFGDYAKVQSLAKMAFIDRDTELSNRNYLDIKIESVRMEAEIRKIILV